MAVIELGNTTVDSHISMAKAVKEYGFDNDLTETELWQFAHKTLTYVERAETIPIWISDYFNGLATVVGQNADGPLMNWCFNTFKLSDLRKYSD